MKWGELRALGSRSGWLLVLGIMPHLPLQTLGEESVRWWVPKFLSRVERDGDGNLWNVTLEGGGASGMVVLWSGLDRSRLAVSELQRTEV